MSDAQRRDKLPLMNGPTANSWPSFGIRTEKDETGGGESLVLSWPVLGLPSKFPGTFPPPGTLIATSFHSNFFISPFRANLPFLFERKFISLYFFSIYRINK